MRILQVCKKFPYPLRDGEVIAIHQLTRGFHDAGHKVTVAAINTRKHFFPPAELPVENQELADFHSVLLDTDVNWWDALRSMFRGDSYNIQRFVSPDFEKLLSGILLKNEFDIVQLEGLYLLPYLLTVRKYSKAKVVLRAHNIEHLIWERNSKLVKTGAKKWYLQTLAARMKEFEIYNINSCDALIPISDVDAAKFIELGCKLPIHSCPIGMNINGSLTVSDKISFKFPEREIAEEKDSLAYIGSMDWLPNREGIEWFLEKVWPKVHGQYPKAKLFLAGRNFPEDFPDTKQPNLELVGEVENARAFIRSKAIIIVPLFSGSGIRVKIIEAMAEGKPVIATTVAAEGIDITNGENILIADDADGFARHIKKCLNDAEFAHQLGENSRTFVKQHYDIRKHIEHLLQFYQSLLK
ncbi:MAG: glycosyltransferase family 4 protein [Chitinophagales bacterium]|nr:glycosyltransferase family 4 protein [Chitinophagales bacterium]